VRGRSERVVWMWEEVVRGREAKAVKVQVRQRSHHGSRDRVPLRSDRLRFFTSHFRFCLLVVFNSYLHQTVALFAHNNSISYERQSASPSSLIPSWINSVPSRIGFECSSLSLLITKHVIFYLKSAAGASRRVSRGMVGQCFFICLTPVSVYVNNQ
jgi:hypothetical protein